MEYRASAEDIARISHAHPTFSEAIKEAALAATENRAIQYSHYNTYISIYLF